MTHAPRTPPPSPPPDAAARTVAHYTSNAESFWEATRDHDVTQNLEALLSAIAATEPPVAPPYDILDFGCGPGRDVLALQKLGHRAVGLDGTTRFCEMARALTGATILEQSFLSLSLPPASFDGIFANASLFHVPTRDLPRVLRELHDALRPHGVLFSSNPRGGNREGFNGERYGVWHEHEAWLAFLNDAGFDEVRHYYRPEGKPRDEQPWLAVVARRRDP